MSEPKKIPFKRRIFLWAGERIAGTIIRLLKKTVKITIVGRENLDTLLSQCGRALFVFWHGKMIIPMMAHIDEGIVVLVSEHGDGEIIARILKSLGYDLVRGSTSRGGVKALKEMIVRFKEPGIIGITPDGPKGPYRKLKLGAVQLAQKTGVPILPMSAYTNKPLFLKSWDRFHLVKPFERCVLMYGQPIAVEKDIDGEQLEQKRKEIEQVLWTLDKAAETFFTKPC